MTLNVPESKCRLHIAMACWPDVTAETATFLRSLHWRIRRSVEMVHGEEYTHDQVAAHLRVSRETVASDLSRAYTAYEAMFPTN